jgi:hypothetical protein
MGFWFKSNSLNNKIKNKLVKKLYCEGDVDAIYLKEKNYNYSFLNCIKKAENLRKKFMLNLIKDMQTLPKTRFDIFYELIEINVNLI